MSETPTTPAPEPAPKKTKGGIPVKSGYRTPPKKRPNWTPEEAREMGRKGGQTMKANAEARVNADAAITPEQLQILERRFTNPEAYGDGKITLKIPGRWTLRWVNTDINSRYDRATGMQGWIPVRPAELMNTRQINNYRVTPDGFVARGQRMAEILMRMPTEFYDQIQRRKAEINQKALRKGNLKTAVQERMANAGRPDLAEQADHIRDLSVETREIIDLDPNDQPPTV